MPYTKQGPFHDGTAPYLSAATFTAIDAGVAAVQPTNAANALTGWFHIDAYGALGNGTTDDRAAIQAAIDAANAAYTTTGAQQVVYVPPRVHVVGWTNYVLSTGDVYGAVGLMLKDGVHLTGPGTIKVANGVNGGNTYYRAVGSINTGISHASINGITFDGNTGGNTASQQCNNIDLYIADDVEISTTRHLNANGNAIIAHGDYGRIATNIRVVDNYINGANTIGIQCAHFNGLIITGNHVINTADNGIDIYGDDGSSSTVDTTNFVIANNVLKNNLVGIFPETVAQGVIVGNHITGATGAGIHLNRIHGAPHDILVAENTVIGGPYGIYVTGDTGGDVIRGNLCTGFTTAGIQLGGGGGNVSYVTIDGNSLNGATASTPLVQFSGNQVANIRVRGTITNSPNRGYDIVYQNVTTSFQVIAEPMSPLDTTVTALQTASAGTFTISAPTYSAGTLTIHGSSGGAWASVWHGVWVTDGNSKVTVTATGSAFVSTGQAVASVAGSNTNTNITVTAAATGSSCSFDYTIRRVTF